MIQFILNHFAALFAGFSALGWGLCEILVQCPSVEANSTFQLVFMVFKELKGRA